ncbi:type IV secretory system conjugative DNA transfer family protein [Komagataeibacter nataicola]|uniref:TraD/TraG TraM recognition site domain-containing protein n=1 Tax=Komagataeibacter nataicola TaxID=265960 RepID=A0ABX5PAN0_9PROT|nr:type IV secretion system DNA-binding domain-containing protein [Komagataeibacter nataicola]PYD66308.1 hypothetical protein CDI09_09170 [Komagataeibacter nataicola]WNM10355.1 type IV secretion system DNA-binding domain-containing protein [Komagataeibacter nataicola]GBR23519.1 hypothetical protein AA0616_2542 [Komagataeibacter nataicola NRIC 0616]
MMDLSNNTGDIPGMSLLHMPTMPHLNVDFITHLGMNAIIVIAILCILPLAVKRFTGRSVTSYIIKGFAAYIGFMAYVLGMINDFIMNIAGNTRYIPYTKDLNELEDMLAEKYELAHEDGLNDGEYASASREARLAIAKKTYSEPKYAFLFKTIPDHFRRSLVWYGRLVTGDDVTLLAWRKFTLKNIRALAYGSVEKANSIQARFFAFSFIFGALFWAYLSGGKIPTPTWVNEPGVDMTTAYIFPVYNYLTVFVCLASLFIVAAFTSVALSPVSTYLMFVNNINKFWNKANEQLAVPTKDALVVWKHYSGKLEMELKEYNDSVDKAIAGATRGQPVYPFGKAQGVARSGSHLHGPMKGQVCGQDFFSVRQNNIVFGGTGSGKTETILKPYIYRYMSAKMPEGYKSGMYVTDGKGVLWKDIIEMNVVRSRSDIRVIGTGDGQFGINLLQGMTPLELATMFGTILKQVVGESDDIFWSEQATTIVTYSATLAYTLEMIPEVHKWAEFSAFRPWSLMGVAGMATNPKLLEKCVAFLEEVMNRLTIEDNKLNMTDDAMNELAEYMITPAFIIAMSYCKNDWASMPKDTRGSVIANVNVLTGKFGSAGILRDRFCTGRLPAEEMCDVDHASNGGVLMISVGESEWGVVGRIVTVWLSTRFKMHQRRKQNETPERCKKEQVLFVADEFQMLATSGGAESDAEFWNINRSTGTIGLVATQSIVALEKRLGKETTQNILDNFRSKFNLRSESKETNEYFANLGGTILGGYAAEDTAYETQGQRELLVPDVDITYNQPTNLVMKTHHILRKLFYFNIHDASVFARAVISLIALVTFPINIFTCEEVNPFVIFFMKHIFGTKTKSFNQIYTPYKSQFARGEDKNLDALKGLQEQPVFRDTDMMTGSNIAFGFVQVADNYVIDFFEMETYCGEDDVIDENGHIVRDENGDIVKNAA